jgi:hypothetical protein
VDTPRRSFPKPAALLIAAAGVATYVAVALGAQNAGYNYTSAAQCVYIQSAVNTGPISATSTTQSLKNTGCTASLSRGPGDIGTSTRVWKNGTSLCWDGAFQTNPQPGTSVFATRVWSVAPCGGGTYTNRSHGRIVDPSGTVRPNTAGTPFIVSPTISW